LNSVRLSRWVVNQCFDEVSDLIDWEADHFLRGCPRSKPLDLHPGVRHRIGDPSDCPAESGLLGGLHHGGVPRAPSRSQPSDG
jgi:hypothetical protein